MAVLAKKLHARRQNGTQEDFELATTKDETGNTANFLVGSVDGKTVYAGLDTDLTASSLRVKKNGTTYAVKKTGFVAGSQNYTTAGTYTFTAPFTHSYTVEVAGGGGGGGGNATAHHFDFKYSDYTGYGGVGGTGKKTTATLNLVKGHTYSVVVGGGGSGGGSVTRNTSSTGGGYDANAGNGSNGGSSAFNTTTARGGGGGTGGSFYLRDEGDEDTSYKVYTRNGSNGTSYTGGGAGGARASAGSAGWVKIKWE